ncbi:hypothetical protein GHN41_04065 [Pseudomonas helleri]|uniref:Uncharacterized protein n=1 Tax=Pseudomonas helleri TaxID=1608996 RepID=A0A6G1W180_9PSED|nr:hypothetical protein [Pseudomonas helleri]MQT24792.1 hypothetical protein [Pseudomonas helleri]MQU15625.1 hypothetical protein [Pseudomonas helleri]
MTDKKSQIESTPKESELNTKQKKYDETREQISKLTTSINNDTTKVGRLAILKIDGHSTPKQDEEFLRLKSIIETHKTSIKDKTASNAALLRQINALKNQIENDGKGEAATEQEVMLNSKITETNKAIRHLLKITGTTNLVEFVQYVEKTLPSNL